MNHDRDILLREYALAAGADDDRRLRDVLDQACPDCAQELAEAEADLAAFALDLEPVAPSAGARERVLARIRAERAAASTPAALPSIAPAGAAATGGGPNRGMPGSAMSTPSAAPAPRRRSPVVLAALSLVAACIGLGLLLARQDARLDLMSRQVAAVAESQRGTSERITDMVARLDRFRQLGDRLRESEARMAQREREVQTLQAKLEVLRTADVVVALAGAEPQPKAAGTLYYAKAQRRWLVTMSNLAPPVAGRCYELWFITADGKKIASDTFVPDADGLDVAIAAITDEPLGGVAVPTGQVHLAGKL